MNVNKLLSLSCVCLCLCIIGCKQQSEQDKFQNAMEKQQEYIASLPNMDEAGEAFNAFVTSDLLRREGKTFGATPYTEPAMMEKTSDGYSITFKTNPFQKFDEQMSPTVYTYKITYTTKDKNSPWIKQSGSVYIRSGETERTEQI